MLDIPERKIVKKWRLQPGKMFLVDTRAGPHHRRRGAEGHARHRASPTASGSTASRIALDDAARAGAARSAPRVPLLDRQQAFGYTQEDLKFILAPMAADGRGADRLDGQRRRRWRCCRTRPKTLYALLQAAVRAGDQPADRPDPRGAGDVAGLLHRPAAEPARASTRPSPPMRLEVEPAGARPSTRWRRSATSPLFTDGEFKAVELDICYPGRLGRATAWRPRSRRCARRPRTPCASATTSSSSPTARSRADLLPIPALLATAAVHQHLVAQGPAHQHRPRRRDRLGARGASLRAARRLRRRGDPPLPRARDARSTRERRCPACRPQEVGKRFIKAICKGLLKVMSKMGISTYQSYCGAQIFEAVGLQTRVRRQVLHRHREQRRGHRPVRGRRGGGAHRTSSRSATDPLLRAALDAGGEYAYRVRGEEHMWTPDSIAKLQHATRAKSYATYKEYAELINDQTQRHADAARAVRVPLRADAGAARGGRARGGDRQALRHRRDVPRLDLDRGAHHARHRDEPHRRQVEHRRGRRGRAALPADRPRARR